MMQIMIMTKTQMRFLVVMLSLLLLLAYRNNIFSNFIFQNLMKKANDSFSQEEQPCCNPSLKKLQNTQDLLVANDLKS